MNAGPTAKPNVSNTIATPNANGWAYTQTNCNFKSDVLACLTCKPTRLTVSDNTSITCKPYVIANTVAERNATNANGNKSKLCGRRFIFGKPFAYILKLILT